MGVPGMEIWLLIFTVASAVNADSDTFLGGEYQTKHRCEQAVLMQYAHWHLLYGSRLKWECREIKR